MSYILAFVSSCNREDWKRSVMTFGEELEGDTVAGSTSTGRHDGGGCITIECLFVLTGPGSSAVNLPAVSKN